MLDLASSLDVRACLHKALAQQPSGIVIDVSELAADDDIALTVFTAFAATATDWSGCPVTLCGPSAQLRADLDRLTISRAVRVFPTRTLAIAALEASPAARRYRRELSATPNAVAVARHVVVEACNAWNLPRLVDDAEIVVTELVANAVRHAGGQLQLRVALGQRFLHLAVRDGSPAPPVRVVPDPAGGHGGRGLILVDALAASWGSTPAPAGKIVWATLRLPGPDSAMTSSSSGQRSEVRPGARADS